MHEITQIPLRNGNVKEENFYEKKLPVNESQDNDLSYKRHLEKVAVSNPIEQMAPKNNPHFLAAKPQSSQGTIQMAPNIGVDLVQEKENKDESDDTEIQLAESPSKINVMGGADDDSPDDNKSSFIQTKLKIGQPKDKYEQEADAVADRVMRMTDNGQMQMQPMEEEEEMVQPKLRMQPEVKDEEAINMNCALCESEEMVQTKPDTEGGWALPEIAEKISSAKENGSSLSPETNGFMSNAFGADFTEVKIHTGANAVQLNKQLGAKAFTHGNNIFFNQGEYNPQSTNGKHLLAHELTHTIQQSKSNLVIQKTELEEELQSTQQALAGIHEQLRTWLFDWRVNESEARRVMEIMQSLEPAVLLRVVQTLRISDRARTFYSALSDADRLLFDQFSLVFATDTGYLANGDTIVLEVYATSRQTEPEFTLDFRIESNGIRPFFLPEGVQIRSLLPQRAAEVIASAYYNAQIFVEPRVRLRISERGGAYAPRHGSVSNSVWYEAVEQLSEEEQIMRDKRQQFLSYISVVDISTDPNITNASLRYLNWISENYNTEVFLERTPPDLWSWALEQAMAPLPESPIQPFLDLYRHMNNRFEAATDDDRAVLQSALSRYLDWIDQHMADENLSSIDPVEIWTNVYSQSFDLQLSRLRETAYTRVIEERRQQEAARTSVARQERWEEHFAMAMRLWGYSSRTYPYVIPIPSEGRDILVTGYDARQRVLDRLAEELMSYATDNMFSSDFLSNSPEAIMVRLLDSGYGEMLSQTDMEPVQSESHDRHELMAGRVLASFGETVATGLLVIAVVGAAVGAGIVAAPVAAALLLGVAGGVGIMSYMERRNEIERENYDVPVPATMLHSVGDIVGLSQLIEGITGERLGTGRRLGSIERSDQTGVGAGGVVLLLTGSKAYRAGQARGQRFMLSRPGATPPGPEGGAIPNPRETPPVDLSRVPPPENPGVIETQVRAALDQSLRAGFDQWMAEIRSGGSNPETVLGHIRPTQRTRIAQRRAQDFTDQFLELLRQEEIRIRSMDNALNPRMRIVEQAIPGNDGVLIMYNRQPPAQHEIAQAIRLFRRTGEPIRLFGDTASGRAYPGIDGTIGNPPRPLSLKHGNTAANPNFARFQAEEALLSARNNGYSHVEVHIDMRGSTIPEIQAAWGRPSLRPGQTAPRPVFDEGNTIGRIIIQGTDGTWILDPPLGGTALPGIVVPNSDERSVETD
jgi:hypothetical protein